MASLRASSDEDNAEDMDDGRRQQMIRDVLGEEKGGKSRSHIGGEESGVNDVGSETRMDLTLADLVAAAVNEQVPITKKAARARKALLERIHKGSRIEDPRSPAETARTERRVAAEKTDAEISKWTVAVKTLREAPTLDFRQQSLHPNRRTIAAIASELKPKTDLENDVNTMLAAAGVFSEDLELNEENSTIQSVVDPQEVEDDKIERQSRIAKLRQLMFYHEQKAKRLRKIKSKAYHKILRKSAANKVIQQSSDVSLDRDDQVAALLEKEKRRAEERLTLKHKNTSRWSRRAIRKNLGRFNKGVAEALTEQNRIASSLTAKNKSVVSNVGTESDDENDLSEASTGSDNEVEKSTSVITKALKSVVNIKSGIKTDDDKGASGLMRLPFMKRSADRREAQIVKDAQSLLEELEENDAGHYNTNSASQRGRLAFGDDKNGINWDEGEDEPPSEKEADDGFDPTFASKRKSSRTRPTNVQCEEENDNRVASDFLLKDFDSVTVEIEAGSSDEENSIPLQRKDQNEYEEGAQGDQRSTEANSKPATKKDDKYLIEVSSLGEEAVRSPVMSSTEKKKKKKKKKRKEEEGNNGKVLSNVNVAAEIAMKYEGFSKENDKEEVQEVEDQYGLNTDSQAELIAAAFAGDEVMDEFSVIKEAELNDELPKTDIEVLEKEIAMPGWGRWSGQAPTRGQKRKLEKAIDEAKKVKEAAASTRRDATKKSVIISEKVDRKSMKYTAAKLPHPFDSKQHFERSMRQPLAPEMNTDSAFRNLVRPKVLRAAGQLISPPRMSSNSVSVADAPAVIDARGRARP